MASVKIKKRMMYGVFGIIFIFGGIEYAVILPTLWLYLKNTYDAPEYMLGLVLSAYSVAAFFSSPVFGRISDRVGCTKQIFLICSMFELVGSFLYFIGISQWLCVGSRLISGLGAASEAIALAEVSRYTSEKERTGIISNLVASRQIALLIGPGLNLFLRIADFKIGPFVVNKYSSPGAFMVVMWAILMVVIASLYTEPKLIYATEANERRQADLQATIQRRQNTTSGAQDGAVRDRDDDHQAKVNLNSKKHLAMKGSSQGHSGLNEPGTSIDGNDVDQPTYQDEDNIDHREFQESNNDPDFSYPPLTYDREGEQIGKDGDFKETLPYEEVTSAEENFINESVGGPENFESSGEFHDPRPPTGSSDDSNQTITNTSEHGLSCSIDLMVSAERLINKTHWADDTPVSISEYMHKSTISDLVFDDEHFGVSVENDLVRSTNEDDERMPLLFGRSAAAGVRSGSRLTRSQHMTNDPYIERSVSALDDPIAREGKMGFFCNEYIRDEIIAIVCLLFCAMFSQVCVETMVLPLTLKYLDFNELENSLLYCVCGVEILIVFLIMSRLSRCLSDRVLMMFGAFMILASNIWLLWYLPTAPPHNRMKNIPFFAIAVFLDILSLPFLLVCATSLFSKLTRKQTAGLSQGLRRGVVGLGTIIAPLWGSSAASQPYVLLGVLVGLQAISLILCTLSYKRLKVIPTTTSTTAVTPPSSLSNAVQPYGTNHSPGTPNVQVPQVRSAHSTPYGSIQRSFAGSSYRSVGSLSYDPPLLPRPIV